MAVLRLPIRNGIVGCFCSFSILLSPGKQDRALPRIFESCRELSRAANSCRSVAAVVESCRELSRAANSRQEFPRVARSCFLLKVKSFRYILTYQKPKGWVGGGGVHQPPSPSLLPRWGCDFAFTSEGCLSSDNFHGS